MDLEGKVIDPFINANIEYHGRELVKKQKNRLLFYICTF